jgi:hypothetical protein
VNAKNLPNRAVNAAMANPQGPKPPRKRGAGQRLVDGKTFRLADEVRTMQRRAANHDGRIVTIGQLVLFATDTGDAWMLDPTDHLAVRLARDGNAEPVHIEDTDTTFATAWTGSYRIEATAFIYSDRQTGKLLTIHGYPTHKLQSAGACRTMRMHPVASGGTWGRRRWQVFRKAARLNMTYAMRSRDGGIFCISYSNHPQGARPKPSVIGSGKRSTLMTFNVITVRAPSQPLHNGYNPRFEAATGRPRARRHAAIGRAVTFSSQNFKMKSLAPPQLRRTIAETR